jgi:hypothetical protein
VFLTNSLVERQPWAHQAAQLPGTYMINDPAEITDALARLISGSLVA